MLVLKKSGHGSAGISLVELVAVIVIIGILVAILLPGGRPIRDHRSNREACMGNLANLYKGVVTYMSIYGGQYKSPPADANGEMRGSALWVKLCTNPTDILEQDNKGANSDILICPVGNVTHSYMGPANGWSKAKKYVGSDRMGNHPDGGGNALMKNGATMRIDSDVELATVQSELAP